MHFINVRSTALGVLLALGVAIALRCPRLAQRPMHNDEAVNAIKFRELWEQHHYHYDPNEHHGPTLYYATFVLTKLTPGADFDHLTEKHFRFVTVLFGLGLILLLPLLADALGRRATIWAAFLTACSPALVFYSRYYIHEILLLFFSVLALAAGWRYWRTRKLGWILLAGAALGLMHATKETFIIGLAAACLALSLNQFWNRLLDASGPPLRARPIAWSHLAAGLAVWLLVAVALFSSFFTNAAGPLDSIRTYGPWLNRAGGESQHIHGWTFYFTRLLWFHTRHGPVWTEAIILLLAIVGAASTFLRRNLGRAHASFGRFLALYTFLLMAAYTLIPYKTPWCLLNFWEGMILLAGLGAAVLIRMAPHMQTKLVWIALLVAGAGHLAWQAFEAAIPFAADQKNPYVYAQTSSDMLRLVRQIETLSDVDRAGHELLIKVVAPEADYWPLPWYLRAFKNVGWWDRPPADPWAPLIVVSAQLHAALDERKTHLMIGYFELRPQVFFELYVQSDLWRKYLQEHPPAPQPE